MTGSSVRVVFDTNVLISFLIGKRLAVLKPHIVNGGVIVVISDRLIEEFLIVTSRPKLAKYFPKQAVDDFCALLELVAEKVNAPSKISLCRDAKDNFLLDLIDHAKVDYLVTGDQDLLILHPFREVQIITPNDFSALLER